MRVKNNKAALGKFLKKPVRGEIFLADILLVRSLLCLSAGNLLSLNYFGLGAEKINKSYSLPGYNRARLNLNRFGPFSYNIVVGGFNNLGADFNFGLPNGSGPVYKSIPRALPLFWYNLLFSSSLTFRRSTKQKIFPLKKKMRITGKFLLSGLEIFSFFLRTNINLANHPVNLNNIDGWPLQFFSYEFIERFPPFIASYLKQLRTSANYLPVVCNSFFVGSRKFFFYPYFFFLRDLSIFYLLKQTVSTFFSSYMMSFKSLYFLRPQHTVFRLLRRRFVRKPFTGESSTLINFFVVTHLYNYLRVEFFKLIDNSALRLSKVYLMGRGASRRPLKKKAFTFRTRTIFGDSAIKATRPYNLNVVDHFFFNNFFVFR